MWSDHAKTTLNGDPGDVTLILYSTLVPLLERVDRSSTQMPLPPVGAIEF